ncbi:MAG: ABC transporter substrate-binding protein [Rhodospirillaceae bacterium]|jgi:phospholipid transport system substrate-binding protein|nr:ABC transporter substrate-binding protein [Rhodospirillaceae bacterium]MBT4561574.1 ABC transporter substrate-binding protein [Rhodospirillaceae bacterium]
MGKQFTRRLACLCLGVVITGAAFMLPAQAAETDPQKFLRGLAADMHVVLTDDDLTSASRAHAFRQLLRRDFDLPAVGRFVLGRYWRRANEAEQSEFVRLFEDYIVAIYGRRLGNYGSGGLTVTGHRTDGNNGAVVHSKIEPHNAPVILLDWRLKLRESGWRVVDIMVEGVSLALAQRAEFTSVIRSSGGKVSGLLVKLRKKTQTVALSNDAISPASGAVRTQ